MRYSTEEMYERELDMLHEELAEAYEMVDEAHVKILKYRLQFVAMCFIAMGLGIAAVVT